MRCNSLEAQGQVTLWTIQEESFYEKLLKEKVIYGKKDYVDSSLGFGRAYDWISTKMESQIGKKPYEDSTPLWAWYQYLNQKRNRPDLRAVGHLAKGKKGVRIEFVKDMKDILLSDFDLWLFVLNFWNISEGEKDDDEFDRMLQLAGVKFVDKEKYPPVLQERLIESWNKVLDLNYYNEYNSNPKDLKSIQATFWKLSLSEVRKVDYFVSR